MQLKVNTVIIPQFTRRVWSGVYISGTGSILSYLTQKDRLSNLHLFTKSAKQPLCHHVLLIKLVFLHYYLSV